MSNPVLNSEGFENAVHHLRHTLQGIPSIDATPLQQVVRDFERQVDRFRDILGMQAENMQRAAVGASMAYTEESFQNV